MSEQLYRKVGRKYIPIGYSDRYQGFPCEGIWVVYDKPGSKTSQCIAQVGKFKSIDYSILATFIRDKHSECCNAIKANRTIAEMVDEIFEIICKDVNIIT